MTALHLSRTELDAGLPEILASPRDVGVLKSIVRRPAVGERQSVDVGLLSDSEGLVGDNWKVRKNPHPEMQLNIMNVRVAALVAREPARWALAGDQLYIDLDLSPENLPPGTRLHIGKAVVEVTAIPHRGCRKFVERFGRDAMEFVNSDLGCKLNLRGINAKVIEGGRIEADDDVVVARRDDAIVSAESGGRGMNAKALTPILNVSDMQQSFAWFEKLGWIKSWDWGNPPTFGGVCSGKCEIFLCLDGQGGRGKGRNSTTFGEAEGESADKGVWMSIWVDDVDEVCRRCEERGIEVMLEPRDMPWNVREMHIRHPDGHVFRVSKGLERE